MAPAGSLHAAGPTPLHAVTHPALPCESPRPAAEVVARLRAAGAAVVLTANTGSAAALQAALPGDVQPLLLEGGRLRPLGT